MEIKDENGMVLAAETCTEDKNFEIEVSGKVRVKIQAEGHKGGFDIKQD